MKASKKQEEELFTSKKKWKSRLKVLLETLKLFNLEQIFQQSSATKQVVIFVILLFCSLYGMNEIYLFNTQYLK